jgi:sialidase-1
LAFCNAADTKKRDNLTLRISFDDGKTWKKKFVIDSNGKADNAAYSDIVLLEEKALAFCMRKKTIPRLFLLL